MTTKDFFDSVKEAELQGGDYKKADYFKFGEGKNKILILTNPVHFRTAFGVGIVYHGSDYNDLATSRYLCYVKDFKDGKIKLMEMSHTIAKTLVDLADGYHTKFDSFPMPYAIEINAKGAGAITVKYSVIAQEPVVLSTEEIAELASLDQPELILERKKDWQQKEMETNPTYAVKATEFALKERTRRSEAKSKADEKTQTKELETITYDDLDEDDLEGTIPNPNEDLD